MATTPSTFNPNDYAGQPSWVVHDAWVKAGMPTHDVYGRKLSRYGKPEGIHPVGFGYNPQMTDSTWLQNYTGPNDFLYQFASNKPWAQNQLANYGDNYLRNQLTTIQQDDYNGYSQSDKELIYKLLGEYGPRPDWMTDPTALADHPAAGGSPGDGVPNTTGQPGGGSVIPQYTPPTAVPPPGTQGGNPAGRNKSLGQIDPFARLNTLSTQMGNSTGRTSPFQVGGSPTQRFGRPNPRGFIGY